MAIFKGTNREFKRYIGAQLRVVVQQITKKHKKSVGACEYCGSNKNLESAHIRGRYRTDIINLLLGTSEPDGAVSVDLVAFKEKFKAEHNPFEKSMLILCKVCHGKYDSGPANLLPITLDPLRVNDFKSRFLDRKLAEIAVLYGDGRTERRRWKGSRFSKTSDVFRNLRSRHEFRQGKWQTRGIVMVHVRVL